MRRYNFLFIALFAFLLLLSACSKDVSDSIEANDDVSESADNDNNDTSNNKVIRDNDVDNENVQDKEEVNEDTLYADNLILVIDYMTNGQDELSNESYEFIVK